MTGRSPTAKTGTKSATAITIGGAGRLRAWTANERRPGVVVEELAKSFGSVQALAGIDITVEPGTAHAQQMWAIARTWGGLRADGERQGFTVPVNDAWVAACCVTYGIGWPP
jgi:hypothetical protein